MAPDSRSYISSFWDGINDLSPSKENKEQNARKQDEDGQGEDNEREEHAKKRIKSTSRGSTQGESSHQSAFETED